MRVLNMTAMWLLPTLPPIVAASSGSIVADALSRSDHRSLTIIVSYFAWSIGVPPAMALIALYLYRLLEYKVPSRAQIASMIIPVGPFGLGAFG